ncbi:hypothetical protein [Bradyrhizobium sp. RP6]|uniref:hypothetical protein n=1 Tax=Bradyrhizobium sp. RP6 TaxID=2489596 RepID=UPI000F52D49E|nr:hypothetical protein [Bradyrhizobium sp. RP6]RQH06879.1 hypothetical protein EHH60_30200 [Bradyrhizobium sp. RP6]
MSRGGTSMLNKQLASWIVDSVIGRLLINGPPPQIEGKYGRVTLRWWAHQVSYDAVLASAICRLDELEYSERFAFFCHQFLEAPHSPAMEQDGGFQFAHRATRRYMIAEPAIFAADIDDVWQRLRERFVGALRRSGYPYAPVTEVPIPSEG